MSLAELLHGGPPDLADVKRIRAVLMFEEPERQKRTVRFATLLVLASAIATYGLIADSVATVIGAMIVAPLMLPIMGLAFGVSIGDRSAIVSSLIVSLGGIAVAILVGLALSYPFTRFLDPEANNQIISRTSPRIIDMFAALATGLAGAFATSRKDVSDTLPGVAIAISLVPPLANVGILIGINRLDLAAGSMLLFVTNYLAILLTGSFMFGLLGFPRLMLVNLTPKARRRSVTLIVLLALAIMVPLGATSYLAVQDKLIEQRMTDAASNWLAGSQYRIVSATAQPEVRLIIAGKGDQPDVNEFRRLVAGQLFGRQVWVDYVPEEAISIESE